MMVLASLYDLYDPTVQTLLLMGLLTYVVLLPQLLWSMWRLRRTRRELAGLQAHLAVLGARSAVREAEDRMIRSGELTMTTDDEDGAL